MKNRKQYGTTVVDEARVVNLGTKDAASGYAGLNSDSRVTKGVVTSDYLEVTDSAKGLVLKSPDGSRWLITVSNLGILSAGAAP